MVEHAACKSRHTMTPLFGFVVLALHTPWVVPPPGATWIAACAAAPTRAPHPLALAKKKEEPPKLEVPRVELPALQLGGGRVVDDAWL